MRLLADRTLFERITERFPSPVADAWLALVNAEDAAEQANCADIVARSIVTLAGVSAFMAALQGETRIRPSAASLQTMSNDLLAPVISPSTWLGFIQEYPISTLGRLSEKTVEAVRRIVGESQSASTVSVSASAIEARVEELIRVTKEFEALSEHHLFLPIEAVETGGKHTRLREYRCQLFVGVSPARQLVRNYVGTFDTELELGKVYLCHRNSTSPVLLSPLIEVRPCTECGIVELFLASGNDRMTSTLCSPVSQHVVHSSDCLKWLKQTLSIVPDGIGPQIETNPGLVNRKDELDILHRNLQRVIDERAGQAVIIEGQAGMGKTRLAEHISTEAAEQGLRPVTVRFTNHSVSAGQGVVDLYDGWLDSVGLGRSAIADRLRALGADSFSLDEDTIAFVVNLMRPAREEGDTGGLDRSDFDRNLVFSRLANIFCRASANRGVAVLLDDLQWADPGALTFFTQLIEGFRSIPTRVLIVATLRSEELHYHAELRGVLARLSRYSGECFAHLQLGPLTPDDMAILCGLVLPGADDWHQQVIARASGNPYYAIQTIHTMRAEGLLSYSPSGWSLATNADVTTVLPDSLNALLKQRCQRVVDASASGPQLQRVLEWLSVLNTPVDEQVFHGALKHAGEGELSAEADALLDELEREQLIETVTDGNHDLLQFANKLLKEVVASENLSARVRRRMHRAAAQALIDIYGEEGDKPSDIAVHFTGARELELAAEYHIKAADRGQTSGDLSGALMHYSKAVDGLEGTLDEEVRAVRRRARYQQAMVLSRMSKHVDALKGLQELQRELQGQKAALPADEKLAINVALGLGNVLELEARVEEARAQFEQARTLVNSVDDPTLKGRCIQRLAVMAAKGGDMEGARKMFEDALTLFSDTDEADRAQCFNTLGLVSWYAGRLEEGLAYLEDAVRIGDRLGMTTILVRSLNNIGNILYNQGRIEEALERWQRVVELQRQSGYVELLPTSLSNIGLANYVLGHLDEARKANDEAIALLDQGGTRLLTVAPLCNNGLIEQVSGSHEAALRLFGRALEVAREADDLFRVAIAHVHRGWCLVAVGAWERLALDVEALVDLVGNAGVEQHGADLMAFQAAAAWSAGDFDSAVEKAHAAVQRANEQDLRDVELRVRLLLARLLFDAGKQNEAVAAALDANGLAEKAGDIYAQAEAYLLALAYQPGSELASERIAAVENLLRGRLYPDLTWRLHVAKGRLPGDRSARSLRVATNVLRAQVSRFEDSALSLSYTSHPDRKGLWDESNPTPPTDAQGGAAKGLAQATVD
jgi:tetratricopeptide (TPR) repeat protein